jgi:TonB family protein
MFHRFQVNPFDLLGQNEIYPYPVSLPGKGEPQLTIAWNSFHQNFLSELAAFFRWTRIPKGQPAGDIFVDCRIPRRIPYRALLAAALWHIVFFVVPWPHLPLSPKRVSALDNTELTWSGPVEDLPLLNVPKQAHKSASSKPTADDPPAENRDAFHPRQRIFTDPSRPTHPRQTLVNTAAPDEPPKFLPALPNMVQLAGSSAPARPRLEISEKTLAKLRPKEAKKVAITEAPLPDAPNLETRPAELSLAQLPDTPAKPRLEISAGSPPRIANQSQNAEAAPAPEVAPGITGTASGPAATIIALSSAPAPPAPVVEVPKGNLAARVAISPEGEGDGTGGGSGTTPDAAGNGSRSNAGDPNAKSSMGISISGGSPKPTAGVSGLGGGGKLTLPKTSSVYKRPDPNVTVEDPTERTGPPNFARLPPGSAPEQVLAPHRVYSMNVDMPNLSSVTGSWIIHFSEMHLPGAARTAGQLNPPGPLRKVDPKYPQDLMQEHVEGEVILYGVIRPDGSVDSIQLVRGLDKQLDANSIEAFSQWKFRPAIKDGQPVALEAIVHIPFRGPERE